MKNKHNPALLRTTRTYLSKKRIPISHETITLIPVPNTQRLFLSIYECTVMHYSSRQLPTDIQQQKKESLLPMRKNISF
jgi:hypothetical protein